MGRRRPRAVRRAEPARVRRLPAGPPLPSPPWRRRRCGSGCSAAATWAGRWSGCSSTTAIGSRPGPASTWNWPRWRSAAGPASADAPVPDGILTTDAGAVVADPTVDVVVEVIGGIEPARTLILTALKSGKPVVTANKELLANCGAELFEAASLAGVDLLFESAVAGGIPLIRPLRESLAGERIRRIMGIVNGTTNFILSRMSESSAELSRRPGRSPEPGLRGARSDRRCRGLRRRRQGRHPGQRGVRGRRRRRRRLSRRHQRHHAGGHLGGPPSRLCRQAAGRDRAHRGRPGRSAGARWSRWRFGSIPAMVPLTHPLAAVRDSFNAVFVEGDAIGELMFLGRGAGGMPTASAVLGDLLDAAHNLTTGGAGRSVALRRTRIRPIDDLQSAYYLTLQVADRPGVLHAVSGVLGQHRVSIRLMEQEGLPDARRLVRPPGDGRRRPAGSPAIPGPVWCSSPTRPTNATSRPACTICASWTSSSGSAACCESWVGDTGLAGRHRGVPGLSAGLGVHAGRHPPGGRHAPVAGGPAVGAGRGHRVAEARGRQSRPGRSRTGA